MNPPAAGTTKPTTAPPRGADAAAPSPERAAGPRRTTPAMRQYARFKAQHPECVLLFRMGDFYEMFDDDAVEVSQALGLTLTQRTEGIPMAGVPHHALDTYLHRLLAHGYRVAICDQVQDASEAKGIVERAVTRVLTPGTLVDEALLDEGAANVLAAVHPVGEAAGVATAELSTGRFTLVEVPWARLADELARLDPSELLHAEPETGAAPPWLAAAVTDRCATTARPPWSFRPADAGELLRGHYGTATLAGFGLDDDEPLLGPAGALLRYLQETQAPDDADARRRLAHLRPPRRRAPDAFMTIDAASLRSLEIERTVRSGDVSGSLLAVFPRCRTPMGRRMLRQWLCYPLRDRPAIETRQRSVAALVEETSFAAELGAALGDVCDVARITARLAMRRATPRDLVALGVSAARLEAIVALLADRPAFDDRRGRLESVRAVLTPLATTIAARCVETPPALIRDGGLFRDGVDDELDEARGLQRDASQWLARYQQELTEQTGIPTLKVGYNRVFGYYIEVTHAHAEKVPDAFARRQTLKNAERYVTEALKEFEKKVTTADARALERERELFEALCAEAAGAADELAAFADTVAELDVLGCFADLAGRQRYVRPDMVDEPVLEIRQGRHPVLDRTLGDGFVPNDAELGTAAGLALITGPNMAGKSTFIRQVALLTLLAHTGSFVPAERAVIGLTDRIFTRIGASDELHAGQSTFMVEMTETASILHHATERSLVILDEIGRGTSTLDGLSLAWAIAEALAGVGCRTLFATHYHELTGLADRLPTVTNLNVAVREWGDEVIFLHRIEPGRTDRSYGIHVAKIAGLPPATVARAAEILDTLAVQTESPGAIPAEAGTPRDAQLGLFTEYLEHPVVAALRTLDVNAMTPLDAFDLLRRLKQDAET